MAWVMPLLLYRYILKEMLRHLLASLAVLVVVMSFGFAIKPISEGLLGPLELIRTVFYVMPGMAALAMPFAAAFAGTLVFFRMGQDNEVAVCATSGISYVSLLLPVSLTGLGLTLIMFLMSNWVVPLFWQQVSAILEQDIARLMIRQLENREAVEWEDKELVLYADQAQLVTDIEPTYPGAVVPAQQMRLKGVAVGRFDWGARRLRSVHTAELAVVNFYHERGQTYVTLRLTQVTINDPKTGSLVNAESLPTRRYDIESPFHQQPEFMSLSDLRQVARDPDRSRQVQELKDQLWRTIAEHATAQAVHRRLRQGDRPLELLDPRNRRYFVTATDATLDGTKLRFAHQPEGAVQVRVQHGGWIREMLSAKTGHVRVERDDFTHDPRITLTLESVTVTDPSSATEATEKVERRLARLRLGPNDPVTMQLSDLKALPAAALMSEARAFDHPDVVRDTANLGDRIAKLHRDIISRVHERAATAVCAVLALLLASLISMQMRSQAPLAIFFWSFLLTIVAILMIYQGQNLVYAGHFRQWVGIAVIWSGNGIMTLVALNVYRQLRRN